MSRVKAARSGASHCRDGSVRDRDHDCFAHVAGNPGGDRRGERMRCAYRARAERLRPAHLVCRTLPRAIACVRGGAACRIRGPRPTKLERAVTQLGFKGALVNGFSNIGDENTAWYLDDPHLLPFWERVDGARSSGLSPPRILLQASQTQALDGLPAATCSPWGSAARRLSDALQLDPERTLRPFSQVDGHPRPPG